MSKPEAMVRARERAARAEQRKKDDEREAQKHELRADGFMVVEKDGLLHNFPLGRVVVAERVPRKPAWKWIWR